MTPELRKMAEEAGFTGSDARGNYPEWMDPRLEAFAKLVAEDCAKMTEEEARKILVGSIEDDDSLFCLGHYIAWTLGGDFVVLDCQFSADELEAIAWWMRNKPSKSLK